MIPRGGAERWRAGVGSTPHVPVLNRRYGSTTRNPIAPFWACPNP